MTDLEKDQRIAERKAETLIPGSVPREYLEAEIEHLKSVLSDEAKDNDLKSAEIEQQKQRIAELEAYDQEWKDYINTIRLNIPAEFTKQPQLDLCMQRMKERIFTDDAEIEKLRIELAKTRYGYMKRGGDINRYTKYIAELEEQVKALGEQLEHDRTVVADGVTKAKAAVDGRHWLTEGRGSYEWNDDQWHEEFSAAAVEFLDALAPLGQVAANWKDCPQTGPEVSRERIDLKARIIKMEARNLGTEMSLDHSDAECERLKTEIERQTKRIAELEAQWKRHLDGLPSPESIGMTAVGVKWLAEREAEIERLRTALETLVVRLDFVHGDPRYQGVWQFFALHGGNYMEPKYELELNAARVALSGAPASQPDPKDATIERLRTALETARPLVRRCGDWQCDHDGHVNCAFGLIAAALSGAPVAPAPEDPICILGLPYSKHTHPHECTFSVSAPVAPCPDCDTGFPEGRLCLTCKGTRVAAPAPEQPAPMCPFCEGPLKAKGDKFTCSCTPRAKFVVEKDSCSVPAPTKEKL